MDNQQKLLTDLIRAVTERSADESFRHHKWFIKYHLEIVEAIAAELCDKYPNADRFKVIVLAWLHDYEKIIDFDNQYNTELVATKELMKEIGFDVAFTEEMANDINVYNAKDHLETAKIEIQIVSSSDAASHCVGPFMSLYWYENPTKTIDELQQANLRKLAVDWEKKTTLPEIK
ncbi:MAG TPA: hypothetical protein VMR95_03305 [Candidatus Binatia bacterium]|nr:hypothetical protein [Candidatus Binatia bacterium]